MDTLASLKRSVSSSLSAAEPHLSSARSSCHNFLKSSHTSMSDILFRSPTKSLVYAVLFITFIAISLAQFISRRRRPRSSIPSTPALEKASPNTLAKTQPRKPGTWEPSSFVTPTPPPYPDWDIETTKPLPYRPFRYGPKYFVTMGLRNVKFEDWIELDSHYPRFHADKARRLAERSEKCCMTSPEGFDGAVELLEELAKYLPARYPTLYQKTEHGLKNLWSGESFDIRKDHLVEDPMATAGRLVQDDLAIMYEKADGQYYLLAGSILLAGFWRLTDKFGMPLSEIHTSGDVPQFREKLEKGMMNFFRRLKPEEMVARNNYFLQVDDDLAWSYSIGDEDSNQVSWHTAAKNRAIEHHMFRSERQTLRRLPRSGGVVFTIRTYFLPVTEIALEHGVPGRLASAVRSWGDDVAKYKGKERYGDVLCEYLDAKHEEQQVRTRGLKMVSQEEEEGRGYPW